MRFGCVIWVRKWKFIQAGWEVSLFYRKDGKVTGIIKKK